MSVKTEIGIKQTSLGYAVWFKIDNQTFHLDECNQYDDTPDNLETAEFYKNMLKIALNKLKK